MLGYGAGWLGMVFSFPKHLDFWKFIDKKIFFCVYLKIFLKIVRSKILGSKILGKFQLKSNFFDFSIFEKFSIEIQLFQFFDLKSFRKYFSNRHKIIFCQWIFKNPDDSERKKPSPSILRQKLACFTARNRRSTHVSSR